jgi:hypothetical protein
MSPLKRQSQNASAAIASCAKEKDFHGDPPEPPSECITREQMLCS